MCAAAYPVLYPVPVLYSTQYGYSTDYRAPRGGGGRRAPPIAKKFVGADAADFGCGQHHCGR